MAKRTKRLIENETELMNEVRLNKYLSDAGVCSRRQADKFIADGKVLIDGAVATTGSKVSSSQVVTLNGKEIKREEKLVLIAFNKPRGIVCTTDKREKDNIVDFIDYGSRIFPIGRLDKDSEGLILLTNDGNIVNKILRAGNNHEKEYIVTINANITAEFLKGMAAGVPILDTVTKPCEIKALDKNTFQIIITQGLNRQIRRMCEYFGYKVLTLKRVRIMNINLGHLQLGGYRNVTEKEIAGLNESLADSANDIIDYESYEDDETFGTAKFTPKKVATNSSKSKVKKDSNASKEFRKNPSFRSNYKGTKKDGTKNYSNDKTKTSRSDSDNKDKKDYKFGKLITEKSSSDRTSSDRPSSVRTTSNRSGSYKTDGKSDYRTDKKPEYKTEKGRDYKSGRSSSYKSDRLSSDRTSSDSSTSNRSGSYRSEGKSDYRTDKKPEYRTEKGRDYKSGRPSYMSDRPSSDRPSYDRPTSNRSGSYRSEGKSDYRTDKKPEYRTEKGRDYKSDKQSSYKSDRPSSDRTNSGRTSSVRSNSFKSDRTSSNRTGSYKSEGYKKR
jgi:23S rRNA pseudouridine2604 synthase